MSLLQPRTAWYCLFNVLSRPYWKRRWIVQEIYAREEAFVLFANHLVSAHSLHGAFPFLLNNWMVSRVERELPTGRRQDWHHAYEKCGRSRPSLSAFPEMRRGSGKYRAQHWHLLFLLIRLGRSRTSRLEDTFFALRSFLPEGSDLARPAYGGGIR